MAEHHYPHENTMDGTHKKDCRACEIDRLAEENRTFGEWLKEQPSTTRISLFAFILSQTDSVQS
jgi:hypothetical protein